MNHDTGGENPKIDLASEGRKVVGLAAQLNTLQRHFMRTGFERGGLLPLQDPQIYCRSDNGHVVIADVVDQNQPIFVPGSNPYGHVDVQRQIHVTSEWYLTFGLISGVMLGVNHFVGYERGSNVAQAVSSINASLERLYPEGQLTETIKQELANTFPVSTNYTLQNGELSKKYNIEFSRKINSLDKIGGVNIETLADLYEALMDTTEGNQQTTMGDIEYVGSVLTKAKRAIEKEFEIPDDLRRKMEESRNIYNN